MTLSVTTFSTTPQLISNSINDTAQQCCGIMLSGIFLLVLCCVSWRCIRRVYKSDMDLAFLMNKVNVPLSNLTPV
jgi:hypothetical protein